ncbi:hypothetical protein V5G28_017875 [Scytonema sp. PRP1]
MPRQLPLLGDRLVYSNGIIVLSQAPQRLVVQLHKLVRLKFIPD